MDPAARKFVPLKRTAPETSNSDQQSSKQPRLPNDDAETHSRSALEPYCDLCAKAFKSNYVLKSHQFAKHSDAGERLWCPEEGCSASFSRRDTLNRHFRSSHGDSKVACPGCHNLVRKDYLRNHIGANRNWLCRVAWAARHKAESSPHRNDQILPKPLAVDEQVASYTQLSNVSPSESAIRDSSKASAVEIYEDHVDTKHNASDSISPEIMRSTPMRSFASNVAQTRDASPANLPPSSPSPQIGLARAEVPAELRLPVPVWSTTPMQQTQPDGSSDTHTRRWNALKSLSRQTDDFERMSSVRIRVLRHLWAWCEFPRKQEYYDDCGVCGAVLGKDLPTVVNHMREHLKNQPTPRFNCPHCQVGFVFEDDRAFHAEWREQPCTGSQLIWLAGCELPSGEDWVAEACRTDLIRELRIWEGVQIQACAESVPKRAKWLLQGRIHRKHQHVQSYSAVRRGEHYMSEKYTSSMSCQAGLSANNTQTWLL